MTLSEGVTARKEEPRRGSKIEHEAEGVFDGFELVGGDGAEFAFEADGGDGRDALDVGDGGLGQEAQLAEVHLVIAAAALGGKRDVDDEGAGRVIVLAGDDEHGACFGRHAEIGQPDFAGLNLHRGGRGLPVRPRGSASAPTRRHRPIG